MEETMAMVGLMEVLMVEMVMKVTTEVTITLVEISIMVVIITLEVITLMVETTATLLEIKAETMVTLLETRVGMGMGDMDFQLSILQPKTKDSIPITSSQYMNPLISIFHPISSITLTTNSMMCTFLRMSNPLLTTLTTPEKAICMEIWIRT